MSKLSDHLNRVSLLAGRSESLRLEPGEIALMLFDPEAGIKDGARQTGLSVLIVEVDDKGKFLHWQPKTAWLTDAEVRHILELSGDKRTVFEVFCDVEPCAPYVSKKGVEVSERKVLSFKVWATEDKLGKAGIPESPYQPTAPAGRRTPPPPPPAE